MINLTYLELVIYVILITGAGYVIGGKSWYKFLTGDYK